MAGGPTSVLGSTTPSPHRRAPHHAPASPPTAGSSAARAGNARGATPRRRSRRSERVEAPRRAPRLTAARDPHVRRHLVVRRERVPQPAAPIRGRDEPRGRQQGVRTLVVLGDDPPVHDLPAVVEPGRRLAEGLPPVVEEQLGHPGARQARQAPRRVEGTAARGQLAPRRPRSPPGGAAGGPTPLARGGAAVGADGRGDREGRHRTGQRPLPVAQPEHLWDPLHQERRRPGDPDGVPRHPRPEPGGEDQEREGQPDPRQGLAGRPGAREATRTSTPTPR